MDDAFFVLELLYIEGTLPCNAFVELEDEGIPEDNEILEDADVEGCWLRLDDERRYELCEADVDRDGTLVDDLPSVPEARDLEDMELGFGMEEEYELLIFEAALEDELIETGLLNDICAELDKLDETFADDDVENGDDDVLLRTKELEVCTEFELRTGKEVGLSAFDCCAAALGAAVGDGTGGVGTFSEALCKDTGAALGAALFAIIYKISASLDQGASLPERT
jgi:hypothetical protein